MMVVSEGHLIGPVRVQLQGGDIRVLAAGHVERRRDGPRDIGSGDPALFVIGHGADTATVRAIGESPIIAARSQTRPVSSHAKARKRLPEIFPVSICPCGDSRIKSTNTRL